MKVLNKQFKVRHFDPGLATWFHSAIVMECTDCGTTIYKNGIEIGSTAGESGNHHTETGTPMVIGRTDANDFTSVELDELILFNRNLSAQQVVEFYSR